MKTIWDLAREADCTDLAEHLNLIGRRTGAGRGKFQCPFHEDANPSMVTYPMEFGRKSHFHCFACQAHGDAAALLAKVKGLTMKAAATELAKEAGWDGEAIDAAQRSTVEDVPTDTPVGPDVKIVLLICEEWRKYRIERAERCRDVCQKALETYANPDDWRWKVEAHMACHYQDEANAFRSMDDWDTLNSIREELENIGVTPYGRVRFGGEVH